MDYKAFGEKRKIKSQKIPAIRGFEKTRAQDEPGRKALMPVPVRKANGLNEHAAGAAGAVP